MSVFIPIPITEVVRAGELPSLSYRLDFDTGRIMRRGSVDGLQAAEQFIKKTLLTPRFRCLIYDNQYGSELKQNIIAADVSREFIETEIPRLVRDALLIDSRITDVFNFEMSFTDDVADIRFTADTVFGEIEINATV